MWMRHDHVETILNVEKNKALGVNQGDCQCLLKTKTWFLPNVIYITINVFMSLVHKFLNIFPRKIPGMVLLSRDPISSHHP